jgi:SPP1 gp7 family putative phage head morphogenesis protein
MVRVSTALRTRIRSSVLKAMTEATGAEGGFTVADLEGVLQSRFKGILPSNAAVVARTESAMFANDVRQNLMRADGVTQKRWLATNDQWTRESHRELDGVTIGIDERFPNGLLYPCESGGPAEEVIQCRCHSFPWIGDDDG